MGKGRRANILLNANRHKNFSGLAQGHIIKTSQYIHEFE
jgi:hypothetical protein